MIDRRISTRLAIDCEQRNMRQALVGALEVAKMDLPVECRHILVPHIERALDMYRPLPKPTLWQRLQLWIKSEVA